MSIAVTDAIHVWEAGKQFRRLRQVIRVLTLALADASAFCAADLLIRWGKPVPALVLFQSHPAPAHALQIDVFLLLSMLFMGVRFLAGDYSRRQLFWDEARETTRSLIVICIPDFFLLAAAPHLYSGWVIAGTWAFMAFAIPALRQLARALLTAGGLWRIPSALIGEGGRTAQIYAALSTSRSLGYQLRVVLSTAQNHIQPLEHRELEHGTVAGPEEAVHRVLQSCCEQVVIAADDIQSDEFGDIVQAFLEADIAVAIIPSLQRLPLAGLTTSHFLGQDIMLLQISNNSRQLSKRILKRGFDIIGSCALLALFSPLFAAVAIAIKRNDGGPTFYAHERVGRNRKKFGCLKFRTMAVDADARLARWQDDNPELYEEFLKTFKLRDDPRVTKPGKWLRRTSLDELPQLINVLRGDMSLVGPRPVVEQELKDYYGPAAQLYSRVRPGMTGLWQVSGRSDTSYAQRVTYDEWYILNWTFWYDLVILLQTAWIVATGKGAF